MAKSAMLEKVNTIKGGIIFQRVRKVSIDAEGYMSCSCGYVQRMLMPCQHICKIIDDPSAYVPAMFHIRWHKLFYYYFRNRQLDNSTLRTSLSV